MLTVPFSPIIYKIGFIQITWYALVYIIGFLAALILILRASKRKEIPLTEEQCYNFIALEILGIMVGARIFHIIFWGWDYYFYQHPDKIIAIWEGGLSFHGGVLGGLLVGYFYAKKNDLNLWKFADFFAPLAVLMPVFSRLANFINQEIVGTVTNVPWCFKFDYYSGCRHPVQLYASAGRFIFFLGILWLQKKKKFKPGFLFLISLVGVAIGRFFLDFLREDYRYYYLSAGQWLSLACIIIGIFIAKKYFIKFTNKK